MHTSDTIHDVIIAGAGPVGLFLACELRLAGCSVLVLETAPDPHSPLKELPFRLRGLTLPTIESLDRRDLLDAVTASAVDRNAPSAAHWVQQQRRPGGHFAGIPYFHDRIDGADWPYRLPGPVNNIVRQIAVKRGPFPDGRLSGCVAAQLPFCTRPLWRHFPAGAAVADGMRGERRRSGLGSIEKEPLWATGDSAATGWRRWETSARRRWVP